MASHARCPCSTQSTNMTTTSQVLDAAMALNPEQRAELAHRLLLSLEPAEIDEDADQAWAAEIRRRLDAVRDGHVILRDWDEALHKMREAIIPRGNTFFRSYMSWIAQRSLPATSVSRTRVGATRTTRWFA